MSHDLYAEVIAKGRVSEGQEVRISKISAIVIGIVAIFLGYIFEKQNVAFMVGLAFAGGGELQLPGAPHVDVLEGHDDEGRSSAASSA